MLGKKENFKYMLLTFHHCWDPNLSEDSWQGSKSLRGGAYAVFVYLVYWIVPQMLFQF